MFPGPQLLDPASRAGAKVLPPIQSAPTAPLSDLETAAAPPPEPPGEGASGAAAGDGDGPKTPAPV